MFEGADPKAGRVKRHLRLPTEGVTSGTTYGLGDRKKFSALEGVKGAQLGMTMVMQISKG